MRSKLPVRAVRQRMARWLLKPLIWWTSADAEKFVQAGALVA